MTSAHIDTFAQDHLPAPELQPDFLFQLPELQYPEQLNCAYELLDRHIEQGRGGRTCIRDKTTTWTYQDLLDQANRVANVLTLEMGLVPGNRVLLHSSNTPMMVACWFGIVKAGGIAVATMPLLRAKELKPILDIAKISHALCEGGLCE
ncbi:MAG: AMP-binding protein, partial [Burkholderiales bacterium]|nr:AMP-binding protein [Burkholderiales bacterium]